MPMVSLKNHSQNAPWFWKRIESAILAGFIPTATGFITAVPITDQHKVWALASIGFFGGMIKMIGICLKDVPDTQIDKTT